MSNEIVSATLLKRLAEAVNGYRDGKSHWYSIELKFPHDVDVFDSKDESDKFGKAKGAARITLGPYLTQNPYAHINQAEITKIEITLKKNNKIEVVNIDPEKVDALFWSGSSIDKFVFPYYTHVYGVSYAAKLCDEYKTNGIVLYGHTDGTRWLPTS